MIEDVVKGVLDGIWNAIPSKDNSTMTNAVAAWLSGDHGYYCCDGDLELRETALSETDLVEPSEGK